MTELESKGSLWRRDWLNTFRVMSAPELARIVVAIDPSATSTESSDEAGIVVAGRDTARHGYVVGDYSMQSTPSAWATRAISAYVIHHADCIIGEGNNGGEMIEAVRILSHQASLTQSRNVSTRLLSCELQFL